MKGLYLLMTIVRRTDAAEYEAFFRSNGISVTYSANCNGTAHAKTLALLGIEKNEKTLLLSFVSEDLLPIVLKGLTRDMKIDLPDRGIAIAVALSGMGGARALEYLKREYGRVQNCGKGFGNAWRRRFLRDEAIG